MIKQCTGIYVCPVAPTTKVSLIGNNCCPVVRPVSSSGRQYGRQLLEGCSVLWTRLFLDRPVAGICFYHFSHQFSNYTTLVLLLIKTALKLVRLIWEVRCGTENVRRSQIQSDAVNYKTPMWSDAVIRPTVGKKQTVTFAQLTCHSDRLSFCDQNLSNLMLHLFRIRCLNESSVAHFR